MLYTDNGMGHENIIYLEPQVLEALYSFLRKEGVLTPEVYEKWRRA